MWGIYYIKIFAKPVFAIFGISTPEFVETSIGLMVRVFAKDPGDQGSIPGWVISRTQKMILDTSLLNTQHYKVWIKGKAEQSRERSSALPYTNWKGSLWVSLNYSCQLTFIYMCLDTLMYFLCQKNCFASQTF